MRVHKAPSKPTTDSTLRPLASSREETNRDFATSSELTAQTQAANRSFKSKIPAFLHALPHKSAKANASSTNKAAFDAQATRSKALKSLSPFATLPFDILSPIITYLDEPSLIRLVEASKGVPAVWDRITCFAENALEDYLWAKDPAIDKHMDNIISQFNINETLRSRGKLLTCHEFFPMLNGKNETCLRPHRNFKIVTSDDTHPHLWDERVTNAAPIRLHGPKKATTFIHAAASEDGRVVAAIECKPNAQKAIIWMWTYSDKFWQSHKTRVSAPLDKIFISSFGNRILAMGRFSQALWTGSDNHLSAAKELDWLPGVNRLSAVTIRADGQQFAVASHKISFNEPRPQARLDIFDVYGVDRKCVQSYFWENDEIKELVYSPNGELLACNLPLSSQVCLFVLGKSKDNTKQFYLGYGQCLAFSPDSHYFAYLSRPALGEINLCNLENLTVEYLQVPAPPGEAADRPEDARLEGLDFSPVGKFLLAAKRLSFAVYSLGTSFPPPSPAGITTAQKVLAESSKVVAFFSGHHAERVTVTYRGPNRSEEAAYFFDFTDSPGHMA